jgi:hypothetical protein
MFKFFVQNAFHIAHHFHRFHLKQIPNLHAYTLAPSILHHCRQLFSQRMRRSLLTGLFHAIVLSLLGGAEADADVEFTEGGE